MKISDAIGFNPILVGSTKFGLGISYSTSLNKTDFEIDVMFLGPPGCGKTRSMLRTAQAIQKGRKIFALDSTRLLTRHIQSDMFKKLDNLTEAFCKSFFCVDKMHYLPADLSNSILLIDDCHPTEIPELMDYLQYHTKHPDLIMACFLQAPQEPK